MFVGVDGCRGGWVAASTESGLCSLRFDIVRGIKSLFQNNGFDSIIAIDIPIGLPDSGSRACDISARKVLGAKQGSRVFPAPARASLAGATYSECCELNRSACGKAISRQSHGILPKIREVDAAITPSLQQRIREAHPEVSFRVLSGTPLEHSKKTLLGQRERVAILNAEGLMLDPQRERQRLGRALVAIDDLLDASVCLLTARRIAEGKEMLLGDGSLNSRGLRMEIVA